MGESGSTSSARGYAFGPLLLDVVKRVLWRDREVVPLTAKSFELLTVLVASRHRIATKDELVRRVWLDTVVLENTLVRHMSSLRHALGQRADAHDYIVTIPGQGYRFVADVQELAELPRFFPDQRWISFVAIDETVSDASRVYVVPASGGAWMAMTDGRSFDDKPRWAPDGRTLYFVSSRNGFLNVWGRRFDSDSGQPVGDTFQVTSFESPRQMLSPQLRRMEIAVAANRLFLPIAERRGAIWILHQVDR